MTRSIHQCLFFLLVFSLITALCADVLHDGRVVEEIDSVGSSLDAFEPSNQTTEVTPEAWTLDGEPLYPYEFHGLELAGLNAQLEMALDNLHRQPQHDPGKHVWYGRRLAYKWKYREAIQVYQHAILEHDTCIPLYRHRGHVYISTRNFSKAEVDLEFAATLIQQTQDQDGWERDGKPNKYNLPLYTRHFNVYYHWGLSRYLQGNFRGALEAYDHLLPTITDPVRGKNFSNGDSLASAVYWKYMALRRAGYADTSPEVTATMKWVHHNMHVLDVDTYLQLCLLFKGVGPMPDLDRVSDPLDFATLGYGIGNYYYLKNEKEMAISVWERVIANKTYWPAFGFIAAEAELYRLKRWQSTTSSQS